MNKKLSKFLRASRGGYFILLASFCALSLIMGQYWLAAGESLATFLALLLHKLNQDQRDREMKKYLESASNTLESLGHGECPFPAVLIRLGDNGIIWCNEKFQEMIGVKGDMIERQLAELIPGMTTDWLAIGKTQCPQSVTVGSHMFRVYGTSMRAEDARGTMTGVLYFSDLTELYQVRDEYIRSRPVVSIVLIDNYEELTKNLSESGISTLNASLNDAIAKWTEDFHGLYRRMERNRFLFIFEKRDLKNAIEDKFSILEDFHNIVNSSGLPASISLGLGVDGEVIK